MRIHPISIAFIAPAGLLGTSVYAADYLSAAEAEKAFFPDASDFEGHPVALTPEHLRAIHEKVNGPFDPARWTLALAKKDGAVLGYVLTDGVVGKTLLIDYAVGFSKDGVIRGIEVLSYRETHGGEVREKSWRRQFVGKTSASPLRLGQDIRNISGATLSCEHLTEGVRRLAAFVAVALAHE